MSSNAERIAKSSSHREREKKSMREGVFDFGLALALQNYECKKMEPSLFFFCELGTLCGLFLLLSFTIIQ